MRTPNTRSLVIDSENMGGLDYRDGDEVEVNFKTASWDEREPLTELQWTVSREELVEMVVLFKENSIEDKENYEDLVKQILQLTKSY